MIRSIMELNTILLLENIKQIIGDKSPSKYGTYSMSNRAGEINGTSIKSIKLYNPAITDMFRCLTP